MSERILVERARMRRKVFQNLETYLRDLRVLMLGLDRDSKLYLFGSVARGEHVMMSDVDVLVVTELEPARVIAELRKAGFDEPFEFHVVNKEMAERYFRKVGVVRPVD
ncbi:MAG: nucleotidyltransferase domain-containing protein [Candidatus Caldarchaeum sp.]|nr:nucleotidyltransferase domain-containing protein [Candidatus Caldarchaeum sp.]MCS7138390.1 nucleotidyltransferase domain-containing protein [Candidatus Caldarchaeum sp.]MDW7977393.1 nucleotidyltransferase domain-containing protein [Candidatus Caldarchaeum sp.]MDW8359017.1 nucleotidyltransferase domain-containing protein [Candidatus Caldarchaeum sp.]